MGTREYSDALLSLRGGGAGYLIRDTFATDLSAGSINGTDAEPGPGVRVVVDTANVLSISSGRLVKAAGGGALIDPRLYYEQDFAAGLVAKWLIRWSVADSGGGWSVSSAPSGNPSLGVGRPSGALSVIPLNAAWTLFTTGVDYIIWATLHANGGAVWAQGGVYTNPSLLWVADTITWGDPVYLIPLLNRTGTGSSFEIDNVEVSSVASLSTPQAMATVYVSNPSNGVNYEVEANSLHYLTYTLPGTPGAGDKIELRYRMQDVDNYWTAYVERNAGNTDWDFKLDLVSSGTPTNKISVTGIGANTDIAVVANGNTHDCFTRNGTSAWVKRGGTITDATLNTAVETGAWFDAGTPSLLRVFDRAWVL